MTSILVAPLTQGVLSIPQELRNTGVLGCRKKPSYLHLVIILARGFCSTAPSLRDARGEVGAVVWSYISRSVRKPFEGLIFTWTRLFPWNTSLLSTVMDVAHCGEEGEIVKECKELLFVFCSFSTNRSPFL